MGGLSQVIQTGAFTQQSANIINGNFAQIAGIYGPGKNWFVNPTNGSNQADGNSWDAALSSMAEAFSRLGDLDKIFFVGQIKEELVAPDVGGVTIVGAATRPRYGYENSSLFDLGAAWRPPASPTAATPLLEIRNQGWQLINILWDCPVDAAAVRLNSYNAAGTYSAGNSLIQGCQFSDGYNGIEDAGGMGNVLIQGNRFLRLTNAALECTSTSGAVPLQNQILNNQVIDCDGGFLASQSSSIISGNVFALGYVGLAFANGKINTVYNAAQGQKNTVINNYTFDVAGDIDPAGGYTGSADDVWRTFANGTADPVVTSPPA